MDKRATALPLILAIAALGGACSGEETAREGVSCNVPAVTQTVERFGDGMKRVSLLAPDSILKKSLADTYGDVVSPALLSEWMADPREAPGRTVSSPWPERIEVDSVAATAAGGCRATGDVIYMTSVEISRGGAAARQAVTIELEDSAGWRITRYSADTVRVEQPIQARNTGADSDLVAVSTDTSADSPDSMPSPTEIIQRYYDAIDARDYRAAYELWGNEGRASGQSFADFEAGFGQTAHVEVQVGEPGRVDAAAGSRYIDVPVSVSASTVDGKAQHFEGTYSLRRAVVDGATPAQRRWHIYTADIVERQ